MRKRYLTLNCTQEEAEYRLKQQLRVYPPKGIAEENYFKIYKAEPRIFLGRGLRKYLFCFYGKYYQSGKHTHLAYRVRPDWSVFLVYLLLGLLTLSMAWKVIFLDEPIGSLLFALGFLLIFSVINLVAKKNCIIDFEKQLTTKMSLKK